MIANPIQFGCMLALVFLALRDIRRGRIGMGIFEAVVAGGWLFMLSGWWALFPIDTPWGTFLGLIALSFALGDLKTALRERTLATACIAIFGALVTLWLVFRVVANFL